MSLRANLNANIAVLPQIQGMLESTSFSPERVVYQTFSDILNQQNELLARVHPCLTQFPRLCILDVNVSDYESPIIDKEWALIRIESDMVDILRELIQLWGLNSYLSITDHPKEGKYIIAFGLFHGDQLSVFLQHRNSSDASEPVLFGADTMNIHWIFQNQPSDKILNVKLDDISEWIDFSLIKESVVNLKSAVSFISPDFPLVKFSRVSQSAKFMESGKINFVGISNEKESLQLLYSDFPHLHDTVCYLQNHPDLKENNSVWKSFRDFLSSLADMLDSEFMLLPTQQMIEKNSDWQFNYDFWHKIRKYMEECCDFILGNTQEVEKPEIAYPKDTSVEREHENLIAEIDRAANALKDTLSNFIELQKIHS